MHAFKHAVAGSNFCATCGYQRGHLNHIGQAEEPYSPSCTDSALSTVVQIGVELAVDALLDQGDSQVSVDAGDLFSGSGGDFGGGGSSDGW